jgi:predicted RNase H-like HicB family nuclease
VRRHANSGGLCYIYWMSRGQTIDAIKGQYICRFRPEPEGGFTATCAAFAEIVTYGATLEAARGAVREAIELCLEVYRDEGREIPASDSDPRIAVKELVPVKLARA